MVEEKKKSLTKQNRDKEYRYNNSNKYPHQSSSNNTTIYIVRCIQFQ